MSHIDDLLAKHCPSGVEFKRLSDLAVTVPGLTGKTKADFSDGNARFASYRNIFANPSLDLEAPDFVKVKEGERQNSAQLGDILITGSSESLDEVGMSSVVTSTPKEPIYLNSFCFIVRPLQNDILDPDFAKHLFRSESIRKQIRGAASGVTRINISKPRFMKVTIPVPPLEVQRAIVEVLDTFSKLEAELEAELEARKQQYEHYRNVLLLERDGTNADLIPLNEVATFMRGSAMTVRSAIPGMYPLVANSPEAIGTHNVSNREGEFIVIARSGAGAGSVSLWEGPLFLTDAFSVHPHSHIASTRYIYYLLQDRQSSLREMKSGGGVPHVRVKEVELLKISLPSLIEQRRIVEILDQFDALVNDLSVGLPAELAARRQQYEFYRDKLLTFKELPREAA